MLKFIFNIIFTCNSLQLQIMYIKIIWWFLVEFCSYSTRGGWVNLVSILHNILWMKRSCFLIKTIFENTMEVKEEGITSKKMERQHKGVDETKVEWTESESERSYSVEDMCSEWCTLQKWRKHLERYARKYWIERPMQHAYLCLSTCTVYSSNICTQYLYNY